VDLGGGNATVTLSIADGKLALGSNVPAGLASVTGNNTAEVVLTGSLADINTALDGLTYTPVKDANGTRTLTIKTNDNGNTGTDPGQTGTSTSEEATSTVTIAITPVDDAPVLDGSSVTRSFVEDIGGGSAAIAIAPALTLVDVDQVAPSSATITITDPKADDVLAFTAGAFGDIAIDSNAGGVLTLTSAGGATLAQWQAALRSVTFDNTSQEPDATPREVTIKVNDGSLDSNTLSTSITVTPRNDAPTGTSTDQAGTEDTDFTLSLAMLGFSDVDGDGFASVTFPTVTGGKLYYDADGAGSGSAVEVTASQVVTQADLDSGLVFFRPTANLNGENAATISFIVKGRWWRCERRRHTGEPQTITLDLTAVHDTPTITSNGGGDAGAATLASGNKDVTKVVATDGTATR
jgi:hypothetical protein